MWTNAIDLCRDLQRGTISAVDVMAEVYTRIERVNPQVNAVVGLIDRDRALELAASADAVPVAERGPLHGLPWAAKDAVEVQGFATAWGFVPWRDNVADVDDGQAARLRRAGVIFIGRTNMPEFGLGSNTFNRLFGTTLNPYDTTKTCGGSSGGAAVALATQMLPLADGSDMGGSLRNPASFCNVVGFRPSIGRVPNSRGFAWFGRLATTGPMARTVAETALLFSVQAGPDPTDPLTLPEPGSLFRDAMVPRDDLRGVRVGFCPTLHGLPIEPEVMAVMRRGADVLSELGAEVSEHGPDLAHAMEVFQTQRAAGLVNVGNALDRTIPDWRDYAKDTAIWNIERGKTLTAADIIKSELTRSVLYANVANFFQDVDLLVLPAAQVAPFDVDVEWIREINGVRMDTYIDWMTVCCAITVTGLPAISIPGGFTSTGLPVGIQLVGKPRGDLELLRIAHTFEAATAHYETRPSTSAVPHA